MTLPLDKWIEQAARAIWDFAGGDMEFLWTEVSNEDKRKYETWAKAAITAILPDIAEAFAKVADEHAAADQAQYDREPVEAPDHHCWLWAIGTANRIASAIRSLAPKAIIKEIEGE